MKSFIIWMVDGWHSLPFFQCFLDDNSDNDIWTIFPLWIFDTIKLKKKTVGVSVCVCVCLKRFLHSFFLYYNIVRHHFLHFNLSTFIHVDSILSHSQQYVFWHFDRQENSRVNESRLSSIHQNFRKNETKERKNIMWNEQWTYYKKKNRRRVSVDRFKFHFHIL